MYLQKKRGKNASFFINPIPPDSKKNDGPDSVERVHKSSELPKTIEKLESSADHDSCGFCSNICTDHRFFHQEVLFLRKELDNKQKTIDNLLNIITHMYRNSNEPGNNFYENKNAQSVQINATAGERRFQTQNRNNLTVENNA